MAAALELAGATLTDSSPEVEIGASSELVGDADCAIVPLSSSGSERRDAARVRRGFDRLSGAAEIRRAASAATRGLRRAGYSDPVVVTWERGVTLQPGAARGPRRLSHRFPLNAVVVAHRGATPETALEAALARAGEATGAELHPEGLLLAASGVIVAKAGDAVFRVAVGPAAQRIAEQCVALAELAKADLPGVVSEQIPWTLATGTVGLTHWSTERRLPGSVPAPRLSPGLVEQALDFQTALYAIHEGEPVPPSHDADVVAEVATDGTAEAILELGHRLDNGLADVKRGFAHGDFWTGNMLVSEGRLQGVVDWPSAERGRLPLLDVLHLWACSSRELSGAALGKVIAEELLPSMRTGGNEVVRAYCSRSGLDLSSHTMEALVAAYWLQAIAHEIIDPDRDPRHAEDAGWRAANIDAVLYALGDSAPVTKGRRGQPTDSATTVVSDTAALRSIEAEWRELAESRGNPFLTPEWYFSWLGHQGDEWRPYVPVVRATDGTVQGLLPLVVSSRRRIATARFAGAEYGDFFHPVSGSSADDVLVARGAAAALTRDDTPWSILTADYVDPRAPWLRAFLDGTQRLIPTRYHSQPSIFRQIRLDNTTWEAYLGQRSRNLRSQLGRRMRSLEREHEVVFRCSQKPSDVLRDLERLFDLNDRRWKHRGSTIFAPPARAFHRDFARTAAERGWARLWLLEANGEAIAAWYGWRLGGRYLYYQAGFDPAWARFTPGLLLLARTIEAAFDEGARSYEMLLGDEPFKSRFATIDHTAETLVITKPREFARAVVLMDVTVRRVVRRLPGGSRERLRSALRPVLKRWPVSTAP